jgi:transcriptional regulator with XRE-family HTH domain
MSRVERGLANPSLDAVEALAVALDVQVVSLFGTVEDMSPDAHD